MIADLKLDSLRWQAERDQIDSRGSSPRDPNTGRKPDKVLVDYTQSVTHQARQYYGGTQQTPQMAPGVPVTQAGMVPAPYGAHDPNYVYGQTTAGYQPSSAAYAYPSPVGEYNELQAPRSQAYGNYPAGSIQGRGIPGSDAEAQAYYYASHGQPMPTTNAGRGQQPYVAAQPSYPPQPPPRDPYGGRETHAPRDDGGRRRRDR